MARNAAFDRRCTSASCAGRQVGRDDRLRPLVEVLRLVVVELARRHHLAGDRRLGLVVAEHRALDLARVRHAGLDDDLAIEARRRGRCAASSSPASWAFEMPTLEPRLAGLTKSGNGSRASRPSRTPARFAQPVALAGPRRSRPMRQAALRRRRPSSSPCPCRPPRPARRSRRRACWRARAGPAPCRPRRRGRAAPGR